MTLSADIQSKIRNVGNSYWIRHVHDQGFVDLTKGKEIGHRIAGHVDEKTCCLLKIDFDTRYEGKRNKTIKKRSMGDIWIRSQNIYNPINVKSGLQSMNGQPNVVSMKKLLDYILNRQIDSYYLLIIKFDISKQISHKLYFIDLLDWIDFIAYDAGPGQIMLKEQDLYDELDSENSPKKRTIFEKVDILFNLFEQKLISMFNNRKERLNTQKTLVQEFQESEFIVDQSKMEFVA